MRGFTMIEVLVVTAIIGTLTLVSYFAVPQYINRTRDSVRKTHLEKYRVAFEDYFNDKGFYPTQEEVEACETGALQPYLSEVYCDPLSRQSYGYVRGLGGKSYGIYTLLAMEDDPAIEKRGCASGCGPDEDGDGVPDYNYGITSEGQEATGYALTYVEPTCVEGGELLCFANVCGECCPGSNYRCTPDRRGCRLDIACIPVDPPSPTPDPNATPSPTPTPSPILPTCREGGELLCFANVCGECCPGAGYRCSENRRTCEPDLSCIQ